ncbi:hypothetical protein F5B19DRAFT_201641 [Rostrohypoxylon terebratum]|nr:hypothetical protein F5B19DRAFT_201641 [Rostrohypoxylon terebratum]
MFSLAPREVKDTSCWQETSHLRVEPMEWVLDANAKRQTSETSSWILKHPEYIEWKNKPKSILWLHGTPGSGKTTLCTSIIKELQNVTEAKANQIGLAYFFFPFPSTTKSIDPTRGFLPSLLAQLLKQLDEQHPNRPSINVVEQLSKQETLPLLLEVVSHFKKIFVIVDGLDQAVADERLQTLRYINELRQVEQTDVHLLLSSRLYADIEHAIVHLTPLRIPIDPAATSDHDLREFVLQTIKQHNKLGQLPQELQEEILNTILDKSEGIFHWATVALQQLKNCDAVSMVKDTLISLQATSGSLDDLYARILQNISRDKSDIVHKVLQWMVYSLETLTLAELAEAAILEPGRSAMLNEDNHLGNPRDILDILKGLVHSECASDNALTQKIRFAHLSIPEFLTSEQTRHESCVVSAFAIDKDTEIFIAEICLRYILLYFHSNKRSNDVYDFTRFPLLKYACKHWTTHVRKWRNDREDRMPQASIDDEKVTHIESLISSLLSDPETLSCWLTIFDPEDRDKPPFVAQCSNTSALCYAVRSGSLGVVRSLLSTGANAASPNKYGRQPLHLAIELCQVSIAYELLSLPTAISLALAQDASGNIPIVLAVLSDNISLVKAFFQLREFDEIKATMINGIPFIFYLAQKAKGDILEAFLRFLRIGRGGINIKDNSKRTLLHYAVITNNQSAIPILLKEGIDIDSGDAKKDTPLHLAIRKDLDNVSALLINSGADVSLRNLEKKTPLEESWIKRSLDWSSYEVDQEETDTISPGSQAQCHVLKRKQRSMHGEPNKIFRKTYHLLSVEAEVRRDVCIAIMRENRALQQFVHPFIISYLGFTQTRKGNKLQDISIYLEYCEQGDLETRHLRKSQIRSHDDDDDHDDEDLLAGLELEDSLVEPRDIMLLDEPDVWTHMYQLFTALAYLHYGISMSCERKGCFIIPHWESHLHRDIKPRNVVLKSGPNNTRIAKLCDLGTVTIKNETNARRRGTEAYWPPIRNMLSEERNSKWSTKGDVYGLSKTIQDLAKSFTPGAEMQRIFDAAQHELPEKRWNALDVLEEIHRHRNKLREPFISFDLLLGNKPGGYIYQAFLKISEELDTRAPYNQEHSQKQRQKQIKRLELILKDGAAKAFKTHSLSLHLAVLLGDEALLKTLLGKGYDPDEQWPISGWTALHLAAQENKIKCIETLRDYKADPFLKDAWSYQPLTYADEGTRVSWDKIDWSPKATLMQVPIV